MRFPLWAPIRGRGDAAGPTAICVHACKVSVIARVHLAILGAQRCRVGKSSLRFAAMSTNEKQKELSGSGTVLERAVFNQSFPDARLECFEDWPPLLLLGVDEGIDLSRRHWINIGAPQCELFGKLRLAQYFFKACVDLLYGCCRCPEGRHDALPSSRSEAR